MSQRPLFRQHVLLASLALGGAMLAIVLHFGRGGDAAEAMDPPGGALAAADDGTAGCREQQEWSLSTASSFVANAGENGGAMRERSAVTVGLTVTPLSAASDAPQLWRVVGHDAAITGYDESVKSQLHARYGASLYVSVASDGRIDGLYHDANVDSHELNELKTAVALLQALPPSDKPERTLRDEWDPLGRYAAVYEPKDGGKWRKHREVYRELAAGLGDVSIDHSVIETSGSWRTGMTLSLIEETHAGPAGATRTKAQVKTLSDGNPEAEPCALGANVEDVVAHRALVPLAWALAADPAAEKRDLQRTRGPETFDEILAVIVSPETTTFARQNAANRLSAALLLDPRDLATVDATMRRLLASHSDAVQILVAVVGAHPSAEAQQLVATWLRELPSDRFLLEQIFAATDIAPAPTREVADELRHLHETHADAEIRTAALIALGAVGRNAHEAILREELRAYLRSKLTATDVPRLVALRALGNSGDDAALTTVERLVWSPKTPPHEALAAVDAMRNMQSHQAQAALRRIFEEHGRDELRRAAVFALTSQQALDDDTVKSLVSRYETWPSGRVAIVRLLGEPRHLRRFDVAGFFAVKASNPDLSTPEGRALKDVEDLHGRLIERSAAH